MHTFHLFGADVSPDESWRLLEWCHTRGAEEFTVRHIYAGVDPKLAFADVDQAMAPFERARATRRLLEAYSGEDLEREVDLWSLTRDSVGRLRSFFPKGLFSCYDRPDAWLEDPVFFRAGELMLGITSHEHEGVLRIRDDEQPAFAALGIPYRLKGEWVGY